MKIHFAGALSTAPFNSVYRRNLRPLIDWIPFVSLPAVKPDDPALMSLLEAARAGSSEALGEILESYRSYLLLVANQELRADVRVKVAASDLVQRTFVLAHQRFDQYRSEDADGLLAWLRQILRNQLVDAEREFRGTAKRDVAREQCLDDSQRCVAAGLEDSGRTPSSATIAEEEAAALARAMERLRPEQRQVILLRSWQQLSFAEVGREMQRSAEAARKLWARAVEQLRDEIDRSDNEARSQGDDTAVRDATR